MNPFADELAKYYHIEVYRYSKNSNKLGYVFYKEDENFYDKREEFILLGRNKESRKEKEQYIERTFSSRKPGTDYSLEQIENRLRENLNQFNYDNIFSSDVNNKQVLALGSGVNFERGELDIPFVEISNSVKGQFKHQMGSNLFFYSDFLSVVDKHFDSTVYPE